MRNLKRMLSAGALVAALAGPAAAQWDMPAFDFRQFDAPGYQTFGYDFEGGWNADGYFWTDPDAGVTDSSGFLILEGDSGVIYLVPDGTYFADPGWYLDDQHMCWLWGCGPGPRPPCVFRCAVPDVPNVLLWQGNEVGRWN